jgi:hypothetical protein
MALGNTQTQPRYSAYQPTKGQIKRIERALAKATPQLRAQAARLSAGAKLPAGTRILSAKPNAIANGLGFNAYKQGIQHTAANNGRAQPATSAALPGQSPAQPAPDAGPPLGIIPFPVEPNTALDLRLETAARDIPAPNAYPKLDSDEMKALLDDHPEWKGLSSFELRVAARNPGMRIDEIKEKAAMVLAQVGDWEEDRHHHRKHHEHNLFAAAKTKHAPGEKHPEAEHKPKVAPKGPDFGGSMA